jgi:dipeptidyl aminopeptidase/acylaminoacyl peptidase
MRVGCVLFAAAIALAGCGRAPAPRQPGGSTAVDKPAAVAAVTPPVSRCVVTLTVAAADEVRKYQQEDPTLKYLRLSVDDDKQKLDLDSNRNADDEGCESQGLTVLIDRDSAAKMPARVLVDFVNDGGQRGFKVTAERGENVITAATLPAARKGFETKLARREQADEPVEPPPPELFGVVKYKSPVGEMAAYLTPDPKDGKKRAAIVWITGGDCSTIGDVWSDAPAKNDQTASAFRKAGMVMMFPSMRGGNQNPGVREGFLGEVDDVIAATEFLKEQPHVDPDRVYLGGHSTGGTLALLVAASTDQYRAVFAFGPVGSPLGYGGAYVYCDPKDAREMELRSPERWVNTIERPTFVFEGTVGGNIGALRSMSKASTNRTSTICL